jgi:hypothetical protein
MVENFFFHFANREYIPHMKAFILKDHFVVDNDLQFDIRSGTALMLNDLSLMQFFFLEAFNTMPMTRRPER